MGVQRGGRARLSLSARHVGELVAEIAPLVRGARVLELRAAPPRDLALVLEVEGAERPRRLVLSANPDAARLHLARERFPAHTGSVGPFFQRAAAELEGATLRTLEQVRADRIALLEFRPTPSGQRRALLVELFGRRANLVLLGPDDRVLELAVPAGTGADARLAVGRPWQPPGGRAGAPSEPGPSLAESLPEPPEPPGPRADREPALAPLSWRVEAALGEQAEHARNDALRRDLVARTTRRLGRARALVVGLERRRDASEGAERVQQDGELVKGSLDRVPRGADSVELADWFTPDAPPRRIELDPALPPRANAERLFERARKLLRARANLGEELGRARARVAALEDLLERLREGSDAPDALQALALERGLLDERQEPDARKRPAPRPRLPYRSFRGALGSEIRVGRNARDNDALTFRHARGNDLWLHTADAPGSHVVLCGLREREPDEEELLDAAHLAVHFSPLRGRDRAAVHVARRKFVHKPRGAKPGLVTLSGGRVLNLRLQPERLERLLRTDRAGGDPPPPAG